MDCEVSMMSSHLALPRVGHLKEVFHMFAYLKAHSNTELVFDPTPVDFDHNLFERQDWSYSPYGYEGLTEILPEGMPTPHGPSMTIRVYVDSDHAGDLITRHSRTGFIVFLNNSPISWSSKKQGSCETSTFGSEFVAMKQRLNTCVACVLSCKCLVLQLMNQPLCSGTINLSWQTLLLLCQL